MIQSANSKNVLVINQSSTTNAATASGNIDTLGADLVKINVFLSTSDAVSNNPSVLKISESDDTVVSNFVNVTGLVGDTDFTIPNSLTAATSITGPFATLSVRTGPRKRYLKVSVSPLTTQSVTVTAELLRQEAVSINTTGINSLVAVNL